VEVSPRYDGVPVIQMDGFLGDPVPPSLRQRNRFAETLYGLTEAQWSAPSRCQDWSVQDVVAHLAIVNRYWAYSISAGLEGNPTRLLEGFDPVATPEAMVDALRSSTPDETLARFIESHASLTAAVEGLDERSLSLLAEAPPGHLSIRLVILHALWDSWIHERDVVLPLGLPAVEEADEIAGSLAYVAALGPAFDANSGSTRTGALEVRGTDPATRVLVQVGRNVIISDGSNPSGTVSLSHNSVELLEALSFRVPLTAEIADGDRWLLGSLGTVFNQS
jgi:uncharacterized protein (TIGR03083 family)